jgi:WD40 repeat protein
VRTPWFPAPPAPMTLRAKRSLTSPISITAIACSPSGRLTAIAAGIYNTPQVIAIWDTNTAVRSIVLPAHGVIRSIAWSAGEKMLITGRGVLWTQGQGSQGPSIFVWDAESGKELLHFGDDLFGVRSIALSQDGRTLLASGMLGTTRAEGSTLDLWDLGSGKLLKRFASVEPLDKVSWLPFFSGVAFTPDSAIALGASDVYQNAGARRFNQPQLPSGWNRGIRAFRVSDGQEIDLLPHQPTPVRSIAISRDGSRLLFAGARFGVWNLATGSLLWDKINGYDLGLAISPDGTVIARGIGYQEDNHGPYVDTAVELYDAANGDLVSLGTHRTPPTAIDFAASRSSIVAGGGDGDLRFWSWTAE